jgi:predicted dehydrogenase
VGIIGAASIAYWHGRGCKELDCVDLWVVCDVSRKALDRFAETFEVSRCYPGLEEMLEAEHLDIALICNWGVDHAGTEIRIAESHKVGAIFCEKPSTMNAAEAEQLVASAREHGGFIVEAFKFRHHPMHLKAKAMVDVGAIGEPLTIRSMLIVGGRSGGPEMRRPENNWRFDKVKGGGCLNDLGCYPIHHAHWIYDGEPVRAFAHAQPGTEVDDGAYVMLVFPGDRVAQVSVGFAWPAQYIEIGGTSGMLRIERAWNKNDEAVTLEHHSRDGVRRIEFEPVLQYTHQMQHLCDCLATGRPHRVSPENSIRQMRVLDAAAESMATGRASELSR